MVPQLRAVSFPLATRMRRAFERIRKLFPEQKDLFPAGKLDANRAKRRRRGTLSSRDEPEVIRSSSLVSIPRERSYPLCSCHARYLLKKICSIKSFPPLRESLCRICKLGEHFPLCLRRRGAKSVFVCSSGMCSVGDDVG